MYKVIKIKWYQLNNHDLKVNITIKKSLFKQKTIIKICYEQNCCLNRIFGIIYIWFNFVYIIIFNFVYIRIILT